jgi:hypothetical protein
VTLPAALPSPTADRYCLSDVGDYPITGAVDGDHHAPGRQDVGDHDDQRPPDQVAGYRPLVADLDAHVERDLHAEQREHHQAEERPVAEIDPVGLSAVHWENCQGLTAEWWPRAR